MELACGIILCTPIQFHHAKKVVLSNKIVVGWFWVLSLCSSPSVHYKGCGIWMDDRGPSFDRDLAHGIQKRSSITKSHQTDGHGRCGVRLPKKGMREKVSPTEYSESCRVNSLREYRAQTTPDIHIKLLVPSWDSSDLVGSTHLLTYRVF